MDSQHPHLSSGSPFPDRPIILGAEAPENTRTVTCPANGLPTLSRASWSNRITTARLLSNAFSHTPSWWSLPTALYIGASDGSWWLPRLGRETESSLRTPTGRICSPDRRITGAYGALRHDRTKVSCDFEKAASMRPRETLNNSSCSKLLSLSFWTCVNDCVCFYWDAVMSWKGSPVCKWKRCSSWKLWGQQEFARFNPAHLGFTFCKVGRKKIPPRFLWSTVFLCKSWANYDDVMSDFKTLKLPSVCLFRSEASQQLCCEMYHLGPQRLKSTDFVDPLAFPVDIFGFYWHFLTIIGWIAMRLVFAFWGEMFY